VLIKTFTTLRFN